MSKSEWIHVIVTVGLILLIGLITGFTAGYFQGKVASFPVIKEVSDQNPHIATVKLLKTSGGKLFGQIDGTRTRIAYSPDAIMEYDPGQSFEIPLSLISLANYYQAADLPEGVQYLASKQGKYYYSLFDPRALKISPKNRLTFMNEEQAEKSGYMAPK